MSSFQLSRNHHKRQQERGSLASLLSFVTHSICHVQYVLFFKVDNELFEYLYRIIFNPENVPYLNATSFQCAVLSILCALMNSSIPKTFLSVSTRQLYFHKKIRKCHRPNQHFTENVEYYLRILRAFHSQDRLEFHFLKSFLNIRVILRIIDKRLHLTLFDLATTS